MLARPDQVKIPRYLSTAEVRGFAQLRPSISIGMALLEWTSIALVVLLNLRFRSPVLYLVSIPWIGSRMLALGILMHEAAHYRFVKGARGNDILGSLFLAWPLFADLRNYRKVHFEHHWYVNTPRDPDVRYYRGVAEDWSFPMRGRKLARVLLMSLTALDLPKRLRQLRRYITEPASAWAVLLRLAFYALVAVLLTRLRLWGVFLLLWGLPYLSWLNFVARFRDIAEHSAIPNRTGLDATRTYFYSAFGQLFLAPLNVSYHLEHHFHPSAPFYELARLHKSLMSHDAYRLNGHFTYGVRALLEECLGKG